MSNVTHTHTHLRDEVISPIPKDRIHRRHHRNRFFTERSGFGGISNRIFRIGEFVQKTTHHRVRVGGIVTTNENVDH